MVGTHDSCSRGARIRGNHGLDVLRLLLHPQQRNLGLEVVDRLILPVDAREAEVCHLVELTQRSEYIIWPRFLMKAALHFNRAAGRWTVFTTAAPALSNDARPCSSR